MLAVTTDNIDLSLPLTSTLLKRATLAGVSHQQLLGLDRAVSLIFPYSFSIEFELEIGKEIEKTTKGVYYWLDRRF